MSLLYLWGTPSSGRLSTTHNDGRDHLGLRHSEIQWNGGHPTASKQTGSCYCSSFDKYCMCTPSLAIDLVIVSNKDHIWLVKRKDTSQLATMGGFVQVGETAEDAVRRELQEEMGIVLSKDDPIVLLGIYSDPRRDNRRHTVSAVYVIELDGKEQPVAADDVKGVKKIPITDIENYTYFADHKTILLDYRNSRLPRSPEAKRTHNVALSPGDFATDIIRSIC